MNFINFLIERATGKSMRYDIAYHKLITALDTAHVDVSEGKYEFNVGAVIKDSMYSQLNMRIVEGQEDSIKLGKHTSGVFYIVITTTKFPERTGIDALLSETAAFSKGINQYFEQYYNELRDSTVETEPSKHEQQANLGNPANIEKEYDNLIKEIEGKFVEYNKAMDILTDKESKTFNEIKKSSIASAKDKLRVDYFGGSDQEFVKLVTKYPSAAFIGNLDKEAKDKILQRLDNYYEQKLK